MENPKRFSNILGYKSTYFFVLLIFCFVASLLLCFYTVHANKNHKINGFAWSENAGWVSLNCYNDGLLNKCASSDYGLDYDKKTGELSGFAWSEHGGWLCVGKSCASAGLNKAPDNSIPAARIIEHGLLSGWANWTALGAAGWINLAGAETAASGKKFACQNCAQMKGETFLRCEFCFANAQFKGSREICVDCEKCDDKTAACDKCASCKKFGLGIDYARNRLTGWAWNADSPAGIGYGWLQFASEFNKSDVHPPYLQTVGGDVYGGGGVGALNQGVATEGQFNATYRIESDGSIVHFSAACSEPGKCNTDDGWTDDQSVLTLPKTENVYRDEFGALNLRSLFAGQYGEVKKIAASGAGLENPLAGKVYYLNGDLHVGYRNFKNGAPNVAGLPVQSGAGSIVVKGDIYVEGNTYYQDFPVSTIKNLASAGWLAIKRSNGSGGNIYIKSSVENLVGAFYAENAIYTGTTGQADTEKPLRVDGLMVARQFKFERIFSDLEKGGPAELVVYDGRVLTNPPPGFTDITKALPAFK